MSKTDPKPSKAGHIFPAPEWTSLSASLAAALAHEIRNPLLAIKGAAQLLEQTANAEDKPLTQLIIAEARRIENLVATMDPLTPNPAQVRAPLNIHEVVEYVRRAAESFAGEVKFSTHYDPSLPEVMGVREALIQALLNVVKNAVESLASPSGEATRLSAPALSRSGEGIAPTTMPSPSPLRGSPPSPEGRGLAAIPTITLSTRYLLGERMQRPDGTRLNIEVSIADNGPGVDAALVPRLFTPFTSNKEHGKGLGLAIVAKIIEEHGGLIAYDAPPEGGARFSIYLPVG